MDLQLSSIEFLSSDIVDQIAAGEVIERPAQLVKELVENCLDANATSITVEFSEGGRQIKVVDNGQGIFEKDLSKALERHATSKIRNQEDLWKLRSFGFRGEALASIAAVSKLTMTSKMLNQGKAAKVISQFGKKEFFAEVGGSLGTTVEIENLFENVPARLKFLKSAAAESTQIKMTLKALALSNENVEFRVLCDHQLLFYWPRVISKLERAKQVLEIDNLYEGHAVREDVRSRSIFADPNTTAKTSKNIWFFAQNRWIQDRGMQAAVMEAHRNLLMHGEYPYCITWVETDPEKIDVNIHPTKSQVRFLDSSLVFRSVQASVRETLEKAPWIKNLDLKSQPLASLAKSTEGENSSLSFHDQELIKTQYRQKPSMNFVQDVPQNYIEKQPLAASLQPSNLQGPSLWSSLQVLGQAHLTYIITQSSQGLIMIDQHAAHERILFEKLMKSWQIGQIEVQDFLFPLAFDLTLELTEALMKTLPQFEKLGLYLEQMGPSTVGVRGAPSMIKEDCLPLILEKTAHEVLELGGSFSFEKNIGDLCASMACHSAIRAGQALSRDEMTSLLGQMDEFPLSSFCPHGRPVYVEYPLSKMEKDFGRTK